MSFADLEIRVNAAAMSKLSNARALRVGATEDFPVIFDRAHIETGVGVSALQPVFTALDSDLTGLVPNSTQYTIDSGTTYLVRDRQPDGTGMSVVILEEA